MGIISDWLKRPQETTNYHIMKSLVDGLEAKKEKELKKDKEGVDREMAKEEMIESAEIAEEINEQIQELEQEGHYREVEEEQKTADAISTAADAARESEDQEEKAPAVSLERGLVIFQDSEGSLRHQHIGDLSLENITYYSRYLKEIEEKLWAQEMTGEKNA